MENIEHQEPTNSLSLTDDVSKPSIPYRCPVCNGNGLVANGFYMQITGHWVSSSATPEKCRGCSGIGIVWS